MSQPQPPFTSQPQPQLTLSQPSQLSWDRNHIHALIDAQKTTNLVNI